MPTSGSLLVMAMLEKLNDEESPSCTEKLAWYFSILLLPDRTITDNVASVSN